MWLFRLCSQKFKTNQKILLWIGTADFEWFWQNFIKNSSQMQNLAQLGPKNCVCFFFFVFSPLLLLLHFFLLIAWSKFLLIFPLQDFRFKNTKFSASDRAHPSQTPYAIWACNWRWRSTKFTLPLSKTGVQPFSPV